MNKKYIYWGLGLIAVGGLAYYFMSGKKSESAKSLGSGSASNDTLTDGTNSTPTTDATSVDPVLGHRVSTGGSLHQRRVNCRVEARSRGLKGKEKRDFRRDCRKNGGYDDGLDNFLGASGTSGFGCTAPNGDVGSYVMIPQGTYPETYKKTCVSRGFRDRA
jgi:hypothetical protein